MFSKVSNSSGDIWDILDNMHTVVKNKLLFGYPVVLRFYELDKAFFDVEF